MDKYERVLGGLFGVACGDALGRMLYNDYNEVFSLSKEELNPSGCVIDTLVCALWCFINTSSFEDAVCEAVNLGGDADTIMESCTELFTNSSYIMQ